MAFQGFGNFNAQRQRRGFRPPLNLADHGLIDVDFLRQFFLRHVKRTPLFPDVRPYAHFFHPLTITAIKTMSARITAAFTMISNM